MSDRPDFVWDLVIPFLRNPSPSPLSRPPRSALRQPHLTLAARVCRLFHSIAIPLLYTNIITDDLPSLLAHDRLSSRRAHFRLTSSLCIEYAPQQDIPPISTGRAGRYAAIHSHAQNWEACRTEVDRLARFLAGWEVETRDIFPKLHTLAVGAIYGPSDSWKRYGKRSAEPLQLPPPDVSQCAELFNSFIRTSNIREVCVRDLHGPLAMSDSEGGLGGATPHITQHFTRDEAPRLGFAFGRPSRWLFETQDVPHWGDIIRDIGFRFSALRHALTAGHISTPTSIIFLSPFTPIDLVITCSTPIYNNELFDPISALNGGQAVKPPIRVLSDEEQGEMAVKLGKQLTESFSQNTPSICVRWEASLAADLCRVCGIGLPGS